jgi:hypothetical protein
MFAGFDARVSPFDAHAFGAAPPTMDPSVDGVARLRDLRETLDELALRFPDADTPSGAFHAALKDEDAEEPAPFTATFLPSWNVSTQPRARVPAITYDADEVPGVGPVVTVSLRTSRRLPLPLSVPVQLGRQVWRTYSSGDKPSYLVVLRDNVFHVFLKGSPAFDMRDTDAVVFPSATVLIGDAAVDSVTAQAIVFHLTQDVSKARSFLNFRPMSIADATRNVLLPAYAKLLLRDAQGGNIHTFSGVIANAVVVLTYTLWGTHVAG